ncbi:cytochrome p450 [Moniliophthora roreri]|nr:cytochrome p450 [Moniliophthora roreri]
MSFYLHIGNSEQEQILKEIHYVQMPDSSTILDPLTLVNPFQVDLWPTYYRRAHTIKGRRNAGPPNLEHAMLWFGQLMHKRAWSTLEWCLMVSHGGVLARTILLLLTELFMPKHWAKTDASASAECLNCMMQYMMPFGYGSHVCGGQNVAQMMMKIVIATIVRKFDIVTPLK